MLPTEELLVYVYVPVDDASSSRAIAIGRTRRRPAGTPGWRPSRWYSSCSRISADAGEVLAQLPLDAFRPVPPGPDKAGIRGARFGRTGPALDC